MQEPKKILSEVRKAYRLLYDYQARILGLMKFIGGTYGMTYYGGMPRFSNAAPKRWKGNLDNWSWDWLNMYYYEFHFTKEVEGKTLRLSVFLLNDTGYFEAKEDNSGLSELEVESFKAAEDSASKLILSSAYDKWPKDWNGYNVSDFVSKNEDFKDDIYFKHYPLDLFFSEEEALKNLKDFETECGQRNIPLEIVPRLKS